MRSLNKSLLAPLVALTLSGVCLVAVGRKLRGV